MPSCENSRLFTDQEPSVWHTSLARPMNLPWQALEQK